MIDQIRQTGHPDFVFVDRVPHIYALHQHDQLVSWVVVLPSGEALVVDHDGNVTANTTLERIVARGARRGGPRLVQVAEDPAVPRAA
ncbi:MAG TPA: hypothetical protein VFC00_03290 [Micromonosporaceae bacterium]|nr:hypothetical protein [Micromonosporaceae bacterium]